MSKFCRECCKEFKGWCKSFTRTETLLAIVEGILLVLFIIFLVFLILHLLSCKGTSTNEASTTKAYTEPHSQTGGSTEETSTSDAEDITGPVSENTKPGSKNETTSTTTIYPTSTVTTKNPFTVKSSKCTAVYPEDLKGQATTRSTRCTANYNATAVLDYSVDTESPDTDYPDTEVGDGELASDSDRDVVLALVKIKPSGITFGCILTVLSDHWTVTAASCLDSIEEVDSLDAFVMMDNYGEEVKGRSHPVSDVRVHPQYEGGNKSYDLALLKTEEPLGRRTVVLPNLVNYFKITIGEKFDVLGFGKFRSIDNSATGKRVHTVPVYTLPARHCAAAAFEARHLIPLAATTHARCGAAPLCAGVLRARDQPCNYCAGAPLLRRTEGARALLGVMGNNDACGSACEPAYYANAARLAPWIHAVTQ